MLCLGGQNCASRGQVGLAADERCGAEIGTHANILELPGELQEAVDARISVTESVEVDSRLQHRGRTESGAQVLHMVDFGHAQSSGQECQGRGAEVRDHVSPGCGTALFR